ncbi:MAG: alpha/beta fold hydrolase [Acidimicrobiales bacterium]
MRSLIGAARSARRLGAGRTSAEGVREGLLGGRLPFLAAGAGPPVLVLPGLSARHRNPSGPERSGLLRPMRGLSGTRTMYLVQRTPGARPGVTMGDLAADCAAAIRADLPSPLPVVGISSGGAVALHLALDHPDLVERLLLVSAACRLDEHGRAAQRRMADELYSGHPRCAWAALAAPMAAGLAGRLGMGALLWVAGRRLTGDDPSELLATLEAEDRFDLCDRLGQITAPALVVGGSRDGFYGQAGFEQTAAGLPRAELRSSPARATPPRCLSPLGATSATSYGSSRPARETGLELRCGGRAVRALSAHRA